MLIMKQKHPISICIITKNECNVLKECLERLFPHVQNVGHEIVVVDTGSTDDTVGMCRTYTNSIYEFPWIHDFSAARNFAAQKAKNAGRARGYPHFATILCPVAKPFALHRACGISCKRENACSGQVRPVATLCRTPLRPC